VTVAATIDAPRTVRLADVPQPQGTLVEIEGCGVCGSSLPVWEGRPWFSYPLAPGAPGHESWGRVVEVGGEVTAVRPGDRVAVLADNSFVEVLDVPAGDLVVLPPELDGLPFPGEALGCGFNVAARSGFAPGQSVCVVGIGFLGALVTALAADAGAHVIAVSRRPFALDIARAMGAKETVQLDDPGQAVEEVRAHTGDALCDVVVEAVGVQQTLDLAGWLTRVRGRLVIAGFHQDGQRVVDVQGWNWNGIDVVNAHERDPQVRLDGIRAAAAAVAAGRLDPSPLYTHTYPLDRLAEAMDAMVERPDGFLKALVLR
jgi:2-desacetyl-2-hydroxyethyl bacteriochlorophyllide A dehydrogenase